MNNIKFEMTVKFGAYYFFANIDDDGMVEYEFEELIFRNDGFRKDKDKLDKRKSKIFIDLIEKANIFEMPFKSEEGLINNDTESVDSDMVYYSFSSSKYGNAKWNDSEESDNVFYIYLAMGLCDVMGTDSALFSSFITGRIFDDNLLNFTGKGQFKGKLMCFSFRWTNFPSKGNPYESQIENIFEKEDEVGKKIENVFKTQDFTSSQNDKVKSHWNITLVNDSYEIYQYHGKHGENKLIDELIKYLDSEIPVLF